MTTHTDVYTLTQNMTVPELPLSGATLFTYATDFKLPFKMTRVSCFLIKLLWVGVEAMTCQRVASVTSILTAGRNDTWREPECELFSLRSLYYKCLPWHFVLLRR